MFKKIAFALALGMLFSVAASAQVQTDVYWTTYYSNLNGAGDSSIYIINPGLQGAPLDPTSGQFSGAGYLCANIYVFDKGQELAECCSCPISPNGVLGLSLKANLTNNPLTSVALIGGVIKLVSSKPVAVTGAGSTITATCDAGELGPVETILPDLSAWATHIQNFGGGQVLTEAPFQAEPLSLAEAAFLPTACLMNHYLGSGRGLCTCAPQATF